MESLDTVLVALVLKMKEIAIIMMNARQVLYVDQTTAQLHSVLTLKLIAVIMLLLEMKIFAQH